MRGLEAIKKFRVINYSGSQSESFFWESEAGCIHDRYGRKTAPESKSIAFLYPYTSDKDQVVKGMYPNILAKMMNI